MGDFRLAFRALRSAPLVSTVAVLSLALGIGANTALFSLVDGLLLRSLPVAEPHRLVTVSSDVAIRLGFTQGAGWNQTMWDRFKDHVILFDGAFAWASPRVNLSPHGEAQMVNGLHVSGDFFKTLGVAAAIGRVITNADDVRGGGPDGPVVVISHGLWLRQFAASPQIIGTPLAIDGARYTIVGVMPPEFTGIEVGRPVDIVLPLGMLQQFERAFVLSVMLRLKPDQPVEAATATLRTIQPPITAGMPRFVKEPFTAAPAGTGISGGLRQRYTRPLLTILVVALLVLLIACTNIANLLLARAIARQHELSVRLALGATRWRIARLVLAESAVLAALGAAAGLAFAWWSSQVLVRLLSTPDARMVIEFTFDWRVLGFTAALAAATAILFGVAPAFRAMRIPIAAAAKEHGRSASGGSARMAGVFVLGQVALSLVLVATAGLFLRTFERLTSVPLGFDPDRVLVVNVDTARAHSNQATRIDYYHQMVSAVAAAPGVASASASMSTPLGGGSGLMSDARGRSVESRVVTNFVTPRWFGVYAIPITSGRDFAASDTAAAQPVAIVNDSFARKFFPDRNAIGETIENSQNPGSRRAIVGVVADVRAGSFRDPAPPMIYLPLAQSAGLEPPGKTTINLSARSTGSPPMTLARGVGDALSAVSRDLSFTFRPIDDAVDAAVAQERLLARLSGFFGLLGMLLAGLGLYGVTVYSVNRRRGEIGVRMALGASAGDVLRLVLARVSWLTGVGILAGTGASLWLSRFVAPLLYGVEPRDPATLAAAVITLALVAGAAAWVPAYRASQISPAEVLRAQ